MKYFGTDGFRGEANVGLTVEHAYKIGRFVGWYYGANRERKARVIVGKDTRRSSYMFEAALVSGLVASGADAYMLHVIPTPGVAHQTVEGCFDCGSTHMERLQRHVVEQGLDVGFAYDGDADRCLAVDERGRVVDGDQILYVCGVYLNKHGRLSGGTVVPTIASNFGLIKSLERKPSRWRSRYRS